MAKWNVLGGTGAVSAAVCAVRVKQTIENVRVTAGQERGVLFRMFASTAVLNCIGWIHQQGCCGVYSG